MKTTLKTVFTELDDELMELDIQDNAPDIDIGKIKSEVFMQINSEKNAKKKFSKKIVVMLVAAAILVGGTIGAFASGSVQAVFGKIFQNSDGMNELGLFDGGNVEVSVGDDNLKRTAVPLLIRITPTPPTENPLTARHGRIS